MFICGRSFPSSFRKIASRFHPRSTRRFPFSFRTLLPPQSNPADECWFRNRARSSRLLYSLLFSATRSLASLRAWSCLFDIASYHCSEPLPLSISLRRRSSRGWVITRQQVCVFPFASALDCLCGDYPLHPRFPITFFVALPLPLRRQCRPSSFLCNLANSHL